MTDSAQKITLSRETANDEADHSAPEAAPENEAANHKLTPESFLERRRTREMVYVFDLRESDIFQAGNLPGAHNLPFEFMESNLHRLPFAGDMLFYDGGEGTVLQAAAVLDENGFSDFYYAEEGLDSLMKALKDSPDEIKFNELSAGEKAAAVEKVLDNKVREFLARDGGGLELMAIEENRVHVSYQGACGGCASSTEGTLRFIESALTLSLNHPIEVVPVNGAF